MPCAPAMWLKQCTWDICEMFLLSYTSFELWTMTNKVRGPCHCSGPLNSGHDMDCCHASFGTTWPAGLGQDLGALQQAKVIPTGQGRKGEHTHFFDYRWLSIPTSDTVIPTMHFFSMFLKLLWSTVYDMVRIDSDRHWKRCQLAANTGSYCHCPRSTKPAHRRKSWARHCRTNWHQPGLGTTGNQAPSSQKLWEQGKQSHLL